jgi:hypothetical protein
MAGAISGAWLGRGGVPEHLARLVQDAGAWDHAALSDIAQRAACSTHALADSIR